MTTAQGPDWRLAPAAMLRWTAQGRAAVGVILAASTALAVPLTLARERPSLGDDRGIFLGVLGRMLDGQHLYSGVFEHKDPFYFYAALPFAKVFGAQGLFVEDALLLVVGTGLATLLAFRWGLPPLRAILAGVAFLLVATTGPVYVSGATQLLAIVLILGVLLALHSGRDGLAGFLVGLVVLSKLPLLAIVAPAVVVLALPLARRSRTRILIGLVATIASGWLFLLARGELAGYFDQARLNLGYLSVVLRVVGRSPAPRGTTDYALDTMLGSPVLALAAAIMVVAASWALRSTWRARRRRCDDMDGTSSEQVFLASLAGTVVFLCGTAVFSHHLQILAIPAFMACCVILSPRPERAKTGAVALVAFLIASAVWTESIPGLRDFLEHPRATWHLESPLAARFGDVVYEAQERGELPTSREVGLAVIGESNSDGMLFFLPDDVYLGCRYFYQFPWYGSRLSDEIDCAGSADVVLVLPAMDFILANSAEYRRFRASAERMIVDGGFRLIAGPDDVPQGGMIYFRDRDTRR